MRVDNWNMRFLEKLEELKRQNQEQLLEFDWDPSKQAYHCLTFGSTMVEAVTGRNYYQEMAGSEQYDSALGAMRVLQKMGFTSVDQLIGSIFEEKPKAFVIRGDLVMVPGELGVEDPEGLRLVVAVADPPYFWVVNSVHGLSRGSMKHVIKAYGVD